MKMEDTRDIAGTIPSEMEETKGISRRKFLGKGALAVGAGVAATTSLGVLASVAGAQPTCGTIPGVIKHPWGTWGYTPLDPDACAERAYQGWWVKFCCYAVVDGVIGELQDALGTPYTNIDPAIFAFGAGGVNGWGTICGTPLGAAIAANMVAGSTGSSIGNDLIGYYSSQTMPVYEPVTSQYYAKGGTAPGYVPPMPIPTSCSDSPLCHLSVSKWLNAANAARVSDPANYDPYGRDIVTADVERKERCARLAGTMAKKTAEMLNAWHAGTWSAAYPKVYSTGWSAPSNGAPHQGNCVDCH